MKWFYSSYHVYRCIYIYMSIDVYHVCVCYMYMLYVCICLHIYIYTYDVLCTKQYIYIYIHHHIQYMLLLFWGNHYDQCIKAWPCEPKALLIFVPTSNMEMLVKQHFCWQKVIFCSCLSQYLGCFRNGQMMSTLSDQVPYF